MKRSIIIAIVLSTLSASAFAAGPSNYDQVQDARIASHNSQLTTLFNTKADSSQLNSEAVARIKNDDALGVRIDNAESKITDLRGITDNHENRIVTLENAPKPKDGKDGRDGVDGTNGADGANGVDGKNGQDGAVGAAGANGSNGRDGADGKDADMTAVNSAIQQQNKQFSSLKQQIDDNRKKANAGASAAMAAAGVPQVMSNQTFALGAAIGGYESENAVAVGASYRASDNVVIKASVAADTQQGFGYNAGVAIGW